MYFNRFLVLLVILITVSFLSNSKYTEHEQAVSYPHTTVHDTVLQKEENDGKERYLSSKLATTARLGNHIFELVSIYGISRKLERTPQIYILDGKYEKLVGGIKKVMPGLAAKFEIIRKPVPKQAKTVEFNRKCCVFEDLEGLRNEKTQYLYLEGHFYQSFKYFQEFRNEILNMVVEKKQFGTLPTDGKIFCIHVRRGDFVDGQHHSTSTNFTKLAYNFIIEQENLQYEPMKTVIMGDDMKFESTIFPRNFSNIYISKNSPSEDLIYSRYNCDISLITAPSSTFGWWISFLAKNQNSIFYQDIRYTNDVNYKKGELKPDDFYPPQWNPITYSIENDKIIRTKS